MLQRHHLNTLGMLLCAIALNAAALQTWDEAKKPQFIVATIAAIGAVLKAMYQDSPNGPKDDEKD